MTSALLMAIAFATQSPAAEAELKAAMALGIRSAQVDRSLPVANQVVLVPDGQTFLDEVSRWSPEARWPVLFDDMQYAPMFIRRFQPDAIWRRESAGERLKVNALKSRMQAVVSSAWGGSEQDTPAAVYARTGHVPLGIVLTSPTDSAWPAAVALAAGRGQLLSFLEGSWGKAEKPLDRSRTLALIAEVDTLLGLTGVPYSNTGDVIDAITLCRDMPARVEFHGGKQDPVAVTDVVGRTRDGSRYAWTGWILGSNSRSAYMAMCSLFLPRDRDWLCNTYPDSGSWAKYAFDGVPELLQEHGIASDSVDGTVEGLRAAESGGVSTDMIFFTSKGNSDFFDMSNGRLSPNQIPILNTPSGLYFIHSWSLKNPGGRSTVGGTWLRRGVYAYVGSSEEPMLQAFIPPGEVIRRTLSMVPFLPASRWFAGQGAMRQPWRINTIGDPLMLAASPEKSVRTMLDPQRRPDASALLADAAAAMRLTESEPSDKAFADAIDLLVLAARDDLAQKMWAAAMQQRAEGPRSARAVLGPLFRASDQAAFSTAYRFVNDPTRVDRDMLWQLVGPSRDAPLELLESEIRPKHAHEDIRLIAPRLASTRGRGHVASLVDHHLQDATRRNRKELERLGREYRD